jgi:hypothetical protein
MNARIAPPAPPDPAAPAAWTYIAGDHTGFLALLNANRARFAYLAFDQSSSVAAAANNALQRERGLGHHTPGSYRIGQCCGQGPLDDVVAMMLADPDHARILLDPAARSAGVAFDGTYWTININ